MVIMKKPIFILVVIGIIIAGAIIFYFARNNSGDLSAFSSPTPSISVNFSPSPSSNPRPAPKPSVSATPDNSGTNLPTGGQDLVSSPVPWDKLSGEASCELKGEIKYESMSPRVYDNQDAIFTYKGVDHPGRLINWVVSPNDGLSIGPNLFAHLSLPDGESLIGVSLPENPKYKRYELTASITYGRLVDGNVKIYTKQCSGKTTVVLP